MSLKKVAVVVALVCIFGLFTIPASVAEGPLDEVDQFHADGVSTFNGVDINPQTATLKGSLIGGSATMTWELDNVAVFLNGSTSNGLVNCALKDGTASITATKGDTLTMSLGGSGCAGVFAGTGNMAVTYWITGGTGRFNTARGSGSFSWGFNNSSGGAATIHIEGNIQLSHI